MNKITMHDWQVEKLIKKGYNPALVMDNIVEVIEWLENDMNCDGYGQQQELFDMLMESRDEDFPNDYYQG